MTIFEYFSKHPEQSVTFTNAMSDLSSGDVAGVLAYDFSQFQHIVVGGGTGVLLAVILGSASNTRGTLFDLPPVIEQAQKSATLATSLADANSHRAASSIACRRMPTHTS